MTTTEGDALARVTVAADKSEAQLTVLPSLVGKPDAETICSVALEDRQIPWSSAVQKAVRALLSEGGDADKPRSAVVARATPAEHGSDGRVTWLVDEARPEDEAKPQTGDDRVDFYQRSAYVMVDMGQVIGEVTEATVGSDGQDVTGAVLRAVPGKPANLKLDESIMQDARGRLIAQREGVLIRHPDGRALISEVLEISGYVDFSTGNIDFDGDVVVHQGVRDRFVIKTTGNIEVHGLIEAATIQCGGDLSAHTGVAPRGLGQVTVQGRLEAKYLDNAKIDVQGVLQIHREAINSHIQALGGVDSPRAAIIGGESIIVGEAAVGTLGSDGAITTVVRLGLIPHLESQRSQLESIIEQLEVKQAPLLEEQRLLNLARQNLDAKQRERQTEVMFELGQIEGQLTRARTAEQTLSTRIQQRSVTQLTIEKCIHPGVTFRVGDHVYPIRRQIRGPIRIHVKNGRATVEHHDRPAEPLSALGGGDRR